MKNLPIVTKSELSLIESNLLSTSQLKFLMAKTPVHYTRERPAKGGGTWTYVSGGYMKKVLNLMFGWDWDFEILESQILFGEVIVKGKLTVRIGDKPIVKSQYGNKDIMFKRQSDADKAAGKEPIPLSIGNDLKSAATDALKKCAAELGIAADIYNKDEFREVTVMEDITLNQLKDLIVEKFDKISDDLMLNAERILDTHNENKNPETKSFKKLFNDLSAL